MLGPKTTLTVEKAARSGAARSEGFASDGVATPALRHALTIYADQGQKGYVRPRGAGRQCRPVRCLAVRLPIAKPTPRCALADACKSRSGGLWAAAHRGRRVPLFGACRLPTLHSQVAPALRLDNTCGSRSGGLRAASRRWMPPRAMQMFFVLVPFPCVFVLWPPPRGQT